MIYLCVCVCEGAGAQHGAEQQQLPEAAGCREEEDHQCPGGDPNSAGGAGANDQQTQSPYTQKDTNRNKPSLFVIVHEKHIDFHFVDFVSC